jgi:putative flippase GtrA
MYITLSTVIARLLSGIFNFSLNRNYIFKSKNNLTREVSLYLMLFLINMLCSSFFVTLLSSTNPVLLECKIIVDFILFIIGFFIQKKFIFRND